MSGPDTCGPAATGRPAEGDTPRRPRTDLRLVPAALLVWVTAVAGQWTSPAGLWILGAVLAFAAALLVHTGVSGAHGRSHGGARSRVPRSLPMTLAAAAVLAAAAASHAAVAMGQRVAGPVAAAVADRAAIVAELETTGFPRRLTGPGGAGPGGAGPGERWAVPAALLVMRRDGLQITAAAGLLVMGGREWQHVIPGEQVRVTGMLRPAWPGQPQAGILAASSAPVVTLAPGALLSGVGRARQDFSDASARLGGDARGLLPGMVTGNTSELDTDLGLAMKTVGMTHLTAVSGANCSLILGAILLAARTVRLPRPAAAATCLAGLGVFVLMVGPDPSVLRAALMGGIGLVSVAFGRAGRALSLLCVAVISLIIADPALAASYGFILSVLATLGIVVAGRRIMAWLPPALPRWAAAGFAVPLSAQLLCAPVIVLLQPQMAAYAFPANVAAAPFVAPVTLLGTAALPLVRTVPAAADVLVAVAGVFCTVVAGVARMFAGLPGAALPWPEGVYGLCTMGMFSAMALASIWLALHPARVVRMALAAHARTCAFLERCSGVSPVRAPGSGFPRAGARGLVERSERGTLRVCKSTSGRNLQWRLPKPNAPGQRRRTRSPGGT